MTDIDAWKQICEVVADTLRISVNDITPESRLREDLDIDSLYVVELTMALEEKFAIRIRDEDIAAFSTMTDLYEYVKERATLDG